MGRSRASTSALHWQPLHCKHTLHLRAHRLLSIHPFLKEPRQQKRPLHIRQVCAPSCNTLLANCTPEPPPPAARLTGAAPLLCLAALCSQHHGRSPCACRCHPAKKGSTRTSGVLQCAPHRSMAVHGVGMWFRLNSHTVE